MLNIETIKLSDYLITPHKDATKAYETSLEYNYQYTLNNYTKDTIQALQSLQPLYVIKNNKKLKFYNNWFMLNLALLNRIENLVIISNNHIKKSGIEKASWMYLISQNLISLNRQTNLSQFSKTLEKIPVDVRKTIFGDLHSYSPLATVQNLSRETREAIKHQFTKSRDKYTNVKSLLEQLM